jgi:hypothetical protein
MSKTTIEKRIIQNHQTPDSVILETQELVWYLKLLCNLGLHQGSWNYLAENACRQMRVCKRCDKASLRMRHQNHWDYIRENYCGQNKTCVRCGNLASQRTRHIWGPTYSLGWNESGHCCERCGSQESWTNSG